MIVRQRNMGDGFTLIELSVVLVIIGLIVGGVLVGRNLIEAAESKSLGSQLQQYSSAVNTFKTKYDELPGDMLFANVQKFGLTTNPLTCTGIFCNGDGKLDCTSNSYISWGVAYGDCMNFFAELSSARLIEGRYNANNYDTTPQTPGTHFPALNSNPKYGVLAVDGTMMGGGVWALPGAAEATYWIANFLRDELISPYAIRTPFSPSKAAAIDAKIDDGVPNGGALRSIKIVNDSSGGSHQFIVPDDKGAWRFNTPVSTQCMLTSAGTSYNITNTTTRCALAYKIY